MFSSTKEKTINLQAPAEGKKKTSWLSLAGKIIAWQILAVLLVESSLFVAGLGEEEIYKLDPELGFRHMCNKKVTWRSEGFATSYFDKEGLRESGITVAKPVGTYRVVLLGDSLTESLQVPVEESFGYQIEKKLSRELGRPIQVINFGTSGYSTVQEYLQLKKQVLKYQPDLVLLCYNSRDCFENWSPPDEVLTNVRPAALHLPGQKLTVDSSPVTQWMKTPRARFLKNVEFLRENSRLWGLYAAAELDWSIHNETYKKLSLFMTRPGKAIRLTFEEMKTWISAQIQQLKDSVGAAKPGSAAILAASKDESAAKPTAAKPGSAAILAASKDDSAAKSTAAKPGSAAILAASEDESAAKPTAAKPGSAAILAASSKPDVLVHQDLKEAKSSAVNLAAEKPAGSRRSQGANPQGVNPQGANPQGANSQGAVPQGANPEGANPQVKSKPDEGLNNGAPKSGRLNYQDLIVRTLGSLFYEMKTCSEFSGAKFAVVALPVRSALYAKQGMQTAFLDFDYNDEIKMLQGICAEKQIPLLNVHEDAKALPMSDRDGLFFLVHYTPKGHEFVAKSLAPKLDPYVKGNAK